MTEHNKTYMIVSTIMPEYSHGIYNSREEAENLAKQWNNEFNTKKKIFYVEELYNEK